jgi:hypothetical protein
MTQGGGIGDILRGREFRIITSEGISTGKIIGRLDGVYYFVKLLVGTMNVGRIVHVKEMADEQWEFDIGEGFPV